MNRLRAVLLDVDGTLVLSTTAHACAWRDAAAEAHYDRPLAFFAKRIGMGSDTLLPQIDPALRDDRDPGRRITNRRATIFRERYRSDVKPAPDARKLLEALRGRGLRLVVASSASNDELDALLAIANVSDLIDARTTADDADASKPAPDIVTAALAKGRAAPSEAILLGDTPYDVVAAQNAGVPTIAVRTGGRSDADLAGAIEIHEDCAALLRDLESSALGIRSRGPAS